MFLQKTLVSLLLILTVCSCTSGSGGGEDRSESESPSTSGEAVLNCGAVKDNKLINPVKESDGEVVQIVKAADQNALIVRIATGGEVLIKLHGVDSQPSAFRETAISFLNNYAGQPALLIRAGDNCPAITLGGGIGQSGQLVLASGVSVAEDLIRTGFATASSGDSCSGSLVSGCFTALYESKPFTAGPLDSFLWKPVSDSNGNLAIHTGPYGTIVTVNGEVGENQGGGNGYGSLARFSKPGCAYSNPQIVVRSSEGLVYSVGGHTSFTVGSPCNRHCLVDGQIVACSK